MLKGLMGLQISYAAWAALNWVLNHSEQETWDSIPAALHLLHDLLGQCLPDPAVDATFVCRLGLPILLHCMTGAAAGNARAQKLLMLLLDCVACAPDMDIIGDDDRLCEALQRLLKALCEALPWQAA